jgi:septal ring factor EnvC (AmiA/AmiB activator)
VAFVLGAAALAETAPGAADHVDRLQMLRGEIARLEGELEALEGEEQGVLGELERLDAELRLRETEVRAASVRLEVVSGAIEEHDSSLARLDEAQARRRAYLGFRLREIYKGGPSQLLQRVLAGDELEPYWAGLRYASLLSERDARVLERYRADAERAGREREKLQTNRRELDSIHAELAGRRDAVAGARRGRTAMLESIRQDEGRRRTALGELQEAAAALTRLAERYEASGERADLDVKQFRGLLEWPTQGELLAGFGTVVHPEFGTRVPHPGWDIAAPFGANIRTVFEGEVVFADWMRGYGLTAIVDHGGGVLTIYSHASVLTVQAGDRVARGQTVGTVGDTGSPRGAFLYFALRVDGEPEDPAGWLQGP